jgi:ferredoxin-NADP reductase
MDTAFYTGIGLCAVAGLRCAAGVARWLGKRRQERCEFLRSLAEFEEQLDQLQTCEPRASAAWKGYRRFVVQRVIAEAHDTSSIYLAPEDRRALPGFLPGQFLTLRINVPGVNQPAVRCYSLSDRPRPDYYRITVKAARSETNQAGTKGRVSRYLNSALRPGDVLEAQAPRGEFHLHDDPRPAVLIAVGIGITPLLSMVHALLKRPENRQVLLFYGVRNSREHAFRERLRDLASHDQRLTYLPCYSQPLPGDASPGDYVVPGRIDIEFIRRTLPHADFPCYVCGPASFMEGMVAGLREWGVADRDLHFEAFGPSVVKRSTLFLADTSTKTPMSSVTFQQSGVTAAWDGQANSLLETSEAQGLNLPSGCRSGNCGMCATRLLAGRVRYEEAPSAPLDPGFCLTCVAQPASPEVVLEA